VRVGPDASHKKTARPPVCRGNPELLFEFPFWGTREEAEAVLAQVLEDEPDLASVLYVAEVELEASEN
jgi:hypothetical protein